MTEPANCVQSVPLVPQTKGELVVVPPPTPTLAELTASIQRDHDEAERAAQTSVEKGIAAGKKLSMVKELIPHGFFEDHVAANFTFAFGTAQKYMRMAKREAELCQLLEQKRSIGSHLTMREALKFLDTLRKKNPRNKKTPKAST